MTSWSTSWTTPIESWPRSPDAACAPSGCATAPSSSSSAPPAGALLVHRRSDGKDLWPGRWDIAVGGVVGAGEDYDAAAQRELAEEIGIGDVVPVPIGAGRFADADVDLLARCYRVVHDGPFRFADGEVVEVRWVDAAGLAALRAAASFVPDSAGLLPDEILFPLAPGHDPQGR